MLVALSLALVVPFADAQKKSKKKVDLPAVFANARYVYVQAEDGDLMKPGLYPADRDAITDVEQGIRDWKRYALTMERENADLVFIVRKGRIAGVQGRVGVSGGTRRQSGTTYPGNNPTQEGIGTSLGAGGEVGPPYDLLRVFMLTTDGKLSGPLWYREMKDGLDAPSVLLLQQLKDAVERAYPLLPPAKKPTP